MGAGASTIGASSAPDLSEKIQAATNEDLVAMLNGLTVEAHKKLQAAIAESKPAAAAPAAAPPPAPPPPPPPKPTLAADASKEDVCKTLGLAAEEYDEMKKDFDEMDADKSGTVDKAEMAASLAKERGGKTPSEDEVKGMLQMLDQDGVRDSDGTRPSEPCRRIAVC